MQKRTLHGFLGAASQCGSATAWRGRSLLYAYGTGLWVAVSIGCAAADPGMPVVQDHGAPQESCAWFGDRDGDLLYFGISSYWAESRRMGPRAALAVREPARIGRFDLSRETMLPPLRLARGPERGGVWDVLTLDHGDLVYTALSDHVGWINPESGAALFVTPPEAGVNELAELEDGRVAVTQYFEGSVLIYDKSGTLERRLALRASPGTRVAPKSIAFDPTRGAKGWIWVTTDLFPSVPQGGVGARAGGPRHDGRAIDLETGAERVRVESPELQNLVFDRAGTGFFVWSGPEGLVLQTLRADENPDPRSGQRIGLFPAFDASHDFAQDVAVEASNRIVVTLWSGRVFVVEADGVVRSLQLPRDPPGSLFYSAALRGDRICATRCAGVAVVCADLP